MLSKNNNSKGQKEQEFIIESATLVFLELLGKEIAEKIKPLFLKNRTLTVTCVNLSVAQEIVSRQLEIVEKINQKIGSKDVDRIRYLT